ncbi:phthiocerol/phenolphthiocerol synthesis polyketide synthase type I PpsD-like [Acipenser oxyrinchus oxyrinchus]|uniref:Phthiocerol/phenolphthiocerol synthesis polyketide synthase type I PpsD-like n=1 Tax=Acipenser oxyrinchus oxyrinchus TaxID=40147 RepID=A0AAD8GD69_ACIOX|nr:phthiocerol/phenolphthiocerol synthesis polyketide synthase type I PpsD-like [Acipenser oxyrinchus oxyrinchus]
MGDTCENIAVVGIGCNFPGGEGVDNFWKVLLESKNCAVEIPSERFNSTLWYDPDDSKPGKSRTAKAALIDGFNEFDHRLFGIPEAEADRMDPQQKLLLQCTYRALEDAGMPMEKASGTRTGVFIGLMNRDYEMILNMSTNTINHYNGTGTAMSIAANRISYCFNFTGPSLAIDSACSSSLVALHYACQAIKQGDCEMAICGGVSCIIEPRVFVALSKAKMISPEGTSKPFSNKADGYGRGEGCGIVLLKPLAKAQKDFDHVWGIIASNAVNQDGRAVTPITKPSMAQQEELLHRIYSTHVDPSHVQYVEAHGTGTPVGDPTEAGSISNAIAKARPPGSAALLIGSVKGNIGHTESAAGVAGLIKVLLMMHHETIAPSLHYSEDNSSINAKSLRLKIPTTAEKWEESGPLGRAAGVNNFGFGGTNAHVVVRQYKQSQVLNSETQKPLEIFVLSAASEKSMKMMMEDTALQISKHDAKKLHDLAYTSACRRSHTRHKYRKTCIVSSLSHLKQQLEMSYKPIVVKPDTQLAFVFCGNGVTYRGMCKQLLKDEPVFREKVKEIESMFQFYTSICLLERLENEYEYDDFSRPDIVQPLLFTIQVAIASLLKHWGIKPDAIVGHSVGEVAAAHCSGLLPLHDAVKVIYFRSTLQSKVTGGKMLVVGNIPVSEVAQFLPAYSGKACIAAYNSPQSCTLSGESEAIDGLHQKLSTSFKNLFLHVLDVPAAYHSHMMESILNPIQDSIGLLQKREMEVELFSTVTGHLATEGDFTTGQYWAKNIGEPVAFEQAVKSAVAGKKHVVFVEIGPRRALQRNIMEIVGNGTPVFPSVQPDKDYETLLTVVSKAFEFGLKVNWEQFYKAYETLPTPCPRYQFDSIKNEMHLELAYKGNESVASSHHPVISNARNDRKEFTCIISRDATPYIYEHKNNGVVIVPGAFYVELGLASAMASLRPKLPLSSMQLSISFLNPYTVSQNSTELHVLLDQHKNQTTFKIRSQVASYASGKIQHYIESKTEENNILLGHIYKRCMSVMQSEKVYEELSNIGFQYGSVFRLLGDVHFGEEFKEAVVRIKIPQETVADMHEYCIHPVVLDNYLQLTAIVAANGFKSRPGFPSAVGSLIVSQPLQEEMFMYLRTTKVAPDYIEVCGGFTDTEGFLLVELKHVRITFLRSRSSVTKELFFQNEWKEVTDVINSGTGPKAFVFADDTGVAKYLRQHLHPKSTFIPYKDSEKFLTTVPSQDSDYNEVLFLWGFQNLSEICTEKVLQNLVNCCEVYRQVVSDLKEKKSKCSIRTITYRTTEKAVDHINPGFALSGMTRACAAEIPDLSFQLIDIHSVSNEDISALAQVITSYKTSKYPEVMISKGQIYTSGIIHTPVKSSGSSQQRMLHSSSESFVLQTVDPYRMADLHANTTSDHEKHLKKQTVEVQLNKICVHSSDYFPVSLSDLNFGQTLYWNKHATHEHKLLALDFSGTVTAVGSDVKKLKVGDPIASCYPVVASSKVVLPEAACYDSRKLPFLMETPCVSYFILAWEILYHALPKSKQRRRLGVISSEPESSLLKVLALAAKKSGWDAIVGTEFSGLLQSVNKCEALVLLPPFDTSLVVKVCRVSNAKHIVVVCDNHLFLSVSQSLLRSENEEVHIHILQIASVFQKADLMKYKKDIYKWMKPMHFENKSLTLTRNIFQKQIMGSSEHIDTEEPESYFLSKSISLVVLDDVSKNSISDIPVYQNQKQLFQGSSVYIVTGGLSGLGFETVKFIAQRGGGCIVILSRSAPSPERQQEITNLQNQYGVMMTSVQCDISILKDVEKAISFIGHFFPGCPIKGVFHSAVVLHDGLIHTLNRSHFDKVLRPKVAGALNLHYATKHCHLDYFVCYSSIASFIGNSAQTNYAAANSFLDVFCHYRRNCGLAGQSINWGALNLGLLLNKDNLQRFLEAMGIMTMDLPEIHEGLESCLLQNNPQQAVCKLSFNNLNNHVLSQNTSLRMRFYTVVTEELKNTNAIEPQFLQSTSLFKLEDYVRSLLCQVSNADPDELTKDASLSAFGIDSMLAMTLQNRIFQERHVNVPLVKLLDPNTTVSTLVSLLQENCHASPQYDEQDLSMRTTVDEYSQETKF